ncbi:hypothetical protein PHYBOEH_011421 [Phytophthora boehmeriae]|uniref:Uncharacterized protein n=1 Tax=Phytophthora boehmeriae TaxID=109152 RepID=A0A8T1X191_9STRA|nr:hypothetical protein PHYBOEH_011421 [Phytophthora boehmeriae]
MESLAASVGVDVATRMENFANLAADETMVFDALLRTMLKFQFLSNGCVQFDKRNQATQVLLKDTPSSGVVKTVALTRILRSEDDSGHPVIELECVPKVMMLRTLAEENDPNDPGYDPLYISPTSGTVMVLPRMGEGWLVSRSDIRPSDVKEEKLPRQQIDKRGFHRYAPQTDAEYRRYWMNVCRKSLEATPVFASLVV